MNGDESTLASLPGLSEDTLPTVPALTLLWHPDLDRVGQTCPLVEVHEGRLFGFKRDAPLFAPPGTTRGQPIASLHVSREAAFTLRQTSRGYEFAAGRASTSLTVDGQPFQGVRELTVDDLQGGVCIAVGKSVALCLHTLRFPVVRSPAHGLLGSSDAVEDVRRITQRAADDQNLSVLIRGETGTGKELVARALHDRSRRRNGPFVAVNMATIRSERAAADLFGHEKGAFTGAAEARPGLFRAAHGGTLFLDEIAASPMDVHEMLLRVLQDHRVQPVGSTTNHPTDVRIVAATDARIDDEIVAGNFPLPLYYRLAEFRIDLPPLRARREDVGVLLVHFLRHALSARGELSRLAQGTASSPWLPATVVAALALGTWPGNVRELRNCAAQLAAGNPTATTIETIVKPFLPSMTPVSAPSLLSRRPLSRDQLLAALDRTDWNQWHAAKDLGIARETLRKLLANEPQIRAVIKMRLPDLIEQLGQLGGDLRGLSRRLGIDEALLRLRLRSRS
jgi:two-component system nitrogen regulation response regulator GlnG